jgi:lipoyl(octanoyl) transferase
MEERARLIRLGAAPELIWLLEHPPLYTAGTSADPAELIEPARLPVYTTGRGGRYTYHGPGQRIAYVMLDLQRRGPDVRRFVHDLEEWVIATLARFGVKGERRAGRIGIWVERTHPGEGARREEKIAAIGVRLRKWVTFHGLALNVTPDLEHFAGIVPCGISGYGVTSMHALGHFVTMTEVDQVLRAEFSKIFERAG